MAMGESKEIGIGLFCLVNVHTISLDFLAKSQNSFLICKEFGNINRLLEDGQ